MIGQRTAEQHQSEIRRRKAALDLVTAWEKILVATPELTSAEAIQVASEFAHDCVRRYTNFIIKLANGKKTKKAKG